MSDDDKSVIYKQGYDAGYCNGLAARNAEIAEAALREYADVWKPVTGGAVPDARVLFTVENKNGERKVCLCGARQLWMSQKVIAWMPVPEPYLGPAILSEMEGCENERI